MHDSEFLAGSALEMYSLDLPVHLVFVGRQGHGSVAGSELIYLFVMLIVFST